jgi:uncharacterized protein YbjQ (UPF0145 family)
MRKRAGYPLRGDTLRLPTDGLRCHLPDASQPAGYENEIIKAREHSLAEMSAQAEKLGAQGVVGMKFDYESLGQSGMLMVTVSGTAVRF